MDKHRERRALDDLLRIDPSVPRGVVIEGEEPDFLIDSDGHRLGIEVTEYFRPDRIHDSPVQEQEALAMRIVARASELCQAAALPYLWAPVTFHRSVRLTKRDTESVAQALFTHLSNKARSCFEDDGSLPACIESVEMHLIGQEHLVTTMGTLWVPEIDQQSLASLIAKKEKRLGAYRVRCHTVWLLIVLDGFRLSSAVERPTSVAAASTGFDRIVLLHDRNSIIDVPRA